MQQTETISTRSVNITKKVTFSWIYIGLGLSMCITAFWGFAYTYFIPIFAGVYPEVSPALHIHGWSFFLWFLLVPIQAMLIAKKRRQTHITLGSASLVLAVVMVFTGVLIASVRILDGLTATNPDQFTIFWMGFGQLIMFNMVLFIIFYGAAISWRKKPGLHKRLMILATASVLPAAIFRIIIGLTGYFWLDTPGWVMPAAFLLPGVFVIVGMVHDKVVKGTIHRAYIIGLPILLGLHGFGLVIAGTPLGNVVSRIMALFARVFGGLY
jgi:hypothetical protein